MRHVDRVKFVLRKTNDQSVLLQILCTSFNFSPKKYHGELVSRGFFSFFFAMVVPPFMAFTNQLNHITSLKSIDLKLWCANSPRLAQ